MILRTLIHNPYNTKLFTGNECHKVGNMLETKELKIPIMRMLMQHHFLKQILFQSTIICIAIGCSNFLHACYHICMTTCANASKSICIGLKLWPHLPKSSRKPLSVRNVVITECKFKYLQLPAAASSVRKLKLKLKLKKNKKQNKQTKKHFSLGPISWPPVCTNTNISFIRRFVVEP